MAELLLLGGHRKAAARLAVASASVETEGLAGYVQRSAGVAAARGLRDVLAKARALAMSGFEQQALLQLPDASTHARTVTVAELKRLRARLLSATGDTPAALGEFEEAADLAGGLGWLTMAARCQNERGLLAFRSRRWEVAIEAWQRLLADRAASRAQDRRCTCPGQSRSRPSTRWCAGQGARISAKGARCLPRCEGCRGNRSRDANISASLITMARHGEALTHGSAALKCGEEIGDRRLVARVLGNPVLLHAEMGNLDLALGFHGRALKALESVRDHRAVGAASPGPPGQTCTNAAATSAWRSRGIWRRCTWRAV